MSQETDVPSKKRKAGEALAQYRLIRLNGSDEAVYCDAGETPKGRAEADVASGAYVVFTLLNKPGTMMVVASGAIAKGAAIYTALDGKVTASNTGFKFGVALETATADGDVIEALVDPARTDTEELVYANIAASAVITNTDAETAFDKKYTVPADSLQAGDVLRVRAWGVVLDNNGADTLTLKLYFGTELIATLAMGDIADGDLFWIDVEIILRAVGASGSVVAAGVVSAGAAGTATAKPFVKAVATEATNVDADVKLTAQFSAAHADNQVRLEGLTVRKQSVAV